LQRTFLHFQHFHDSRSHLWGLPLHLPSNLFYLDPCCMCALAFALLAWSLPVAKVAVVAVEVEVVCCIAISLIIRLPMPLPITHCCVCCRLLLLNRAICLLLGEGRGSEWRGANVMRQNGNRSRRAET